jgi:hypothetical protein
VRIIEFLLSNIWIVIPILFFLVNLIGKNKREPSPEMERNPRPVATPMEFPWGKVEWEPEYKKDETDAKKTIEVDRLDDVLEYRESTRTSSAELSELFDHTTTIRPENKKVGSSEVTRAISFKKIQRQDIIQGIVWSEVLGKPRAKKPYRISTKYGRQ